MAAGTGAAAGSGTSSIGTSAGAGSAVAGCAFSSVSTRAASISRCRIRLLTSVAAQIVTPAAPAAAANWKASRVQALRTKRRVVGEPWPLIAATPR